MRILTLGISALAAVSQPSASKHIPFPEFYVSVTTSEQRGRGKEDATLSVNVSLSRYPEKAHDTTAVDVTCHAFKGPGIRGFDEQDQRIFVEAAAAAGKRLAFSRTVESRAVTPRTIETQFEGREINGAWRVIVKRAGEDAIFEPEEGERLQRALAEAQAGEAWFRRLLSDEPLPDPSAETHPPKFGGYFLRANTGRVDCNGFDYVVSVDSFSSGQRPEYSTGHTIAWRRGGSDAGSMSGGYWTKMLEHVARALDSAERGQEHEFIPDARLYKVESDPKSGAVKITAARGEFFQNRNPLVGTIDRARFETIQELLTEAEAHAGWFREHEHLFFTADEP